MSWALIMGGSRGIGLGIANALAARKYDLILVARNSEDLFQSKKKIEREHTVRVETISLDLSISESAQTIFEWVTSRNLELRILCNSAGMGGSTDFPDLSPDELRTMIRLNLESAITASHLFIPLLKQNPPSYILNVGSMAGFSPIPIKNVYASTKSALLFFSYSLRYQLRNEDIGVSCVCPGPVFTKPSIEKETIRQLGAMGRKMALYPDPLGESAVRAMFKGKLIIVPGALAGFFSMLLRFLPYQLTVWMTYTFSKKNK